MASLSDVSGSDNNQQTLCYITIIHTTPVIYMNDIHFRQLQHQHQHQHQHQLKRTNRKWKKEQCDAGEEETQCTGRKERNCWTMLYLHDTEDRSVRALYWSPTGESSV
jgi:hypothetical protein